MKKVNGNIALLLILILSSYTSFADKKYTDFSVTYEDTNTASTGKHIVYIASDHEYRGEQTLPALARILARHYGFKCTVLFGIDPDTGNIQPGSSHIKGLEILKEADLLVIAMRFANFEDDQMQHFVDYVDRGGPIVGLRTSTHAFQIPKGRKYYSYDFRYPGEEFHMGFGRQVLGETWVTHYGDNHRQSSILAVEQSSKEHPILRGVTKMHTQAGGYTAFPIEGCTVLARGIILNGMNIDSPVDTSKELMPVVWVRNHASKSGKEARIFTTTQGASQDIENEGFRRLLINAHLWCLSMEASIKPDSSVDFVGPYLPTTYSFTHFPRGVKPRDLAGWKSPIMKSGLPLKE